MSSNAHAYVCKSYFYIFTSDVTVETENKGVNLLAKLTGIEEK